MGRKNNQVAKEAEKPQEDKPAEEDPEDLPIVKELKVLDDKYLELEREFEKAVHKLQREYTGKQQPFLDQRRDILCRGDDSKIGTPCIPDFWLKALKNHPAFEDQIEEWDAPVLEYLRDISKDDLSEENPSAGFKLTFHFVENPYFEHTTLVKEYITEEGSPYNGSIDVKEIKSTEIEWKPGKDVTVEKVAKKVKGGGAKKAKQKGKEKAEPRNSFFRNFFRNLKEGEGLPDGIDADEAMDEEGDDEDAILEYLMENDHECGSVIKDNIIPFAVRWYTGEAAPSSDEDDEDEEEEDNDEDDDDDDEDESDDEPAPKKKAAAKKGNAKKGGKGSPALGPEAEPKKAEECKQQ